MRHDRQRLQGPSSNFVGLGWRFLCRLVFQRGLFNVTITSRLWGKPLVPSFRVLTLSADELFCPGPPRRPGSPLWPAATAKQKAPRSSPARKVVKFQTETLPDVRPAGSLRRNAPGYFRGPACPFCEGLLASRQRLSILRPS